MPQRQRAVFGKVLASWALLAVAILVGTGLQIVTVPAADAATFTKPTNSSPITISSDNTLVWAVNTSANAVSVIRTSDHTKLTDIPVATEPRSVAVDPNNTFAYVASPATNQVTVIKITNANPASFVAAVDTTVGVNGKITTGAEPWDIVISPDGNRVFVANSGQDTITVINATNRSVIGNIDLANSVCNGTSADDRARHFQPRGMAVTLDNSRLFVTRFLSFVQPGAIQGFDLGKAGGVCRVNINTSSTNITDYAPNSLITLAPTTTGFKIDATVPPDGVADDTSAFPNQLQSIVIRGTRAFLPNIAASPTGPLKFNVDTQAYLNQIDNVTGTPTDAGALNLHLGHGPLFFANIWGIAFTTQAGIGNAYAISAGSDLLVKLNVDATNKVAFTNGSTTAGPTTFIDLNDPTNVNTSGAKAGKNPLGIVINESAQVAYTVNFVSRNVSVVNLATDTVIATVALNTLPTPGSQGERNLVGAEMFFSSRGNFDKPGGTTVSTTNRLSANGWQNCASCHFDGWTDGVVWTFNAGPRKSVPLNGTFDPIAPHTAQRVLNYSAIFDEVQDFEANIRNVSGPGALAAAVNGTTNDPDHGLLFDDDGNINHAPLVLNAFAKPNAGRNQFTVTLPGSATQVPALDALKEWVQNAVRSPQGKLTTTELTTGGGNTTGGLNQTDIDAGRQLFLAQNCNTCHGGNNQWTTSIKDFTSPPTGTDIFTETNPAPLAPANPVAAQYLNRFLRDIGSFNLGVRNQPNPIGANIGAREKATGDVQDGLGFDFNNDGKGNGFNVPSLLSIFMMPPYYHNGSCETLNCVVGNKQHRTGNFKFPDVLTNVADQAKVVAFLQSLDAETTTVNATPIVTPQACTPRPAFRLNVVNQTGGKVQVTVTPGAVDQGNALTKIAFGAVNNGILTVNGQNTAGPTTVIFQPSVASFVFTIQRSDNSKGVTAPMVITDTCGDWQTFTGFGTNVN